MTTPFDLSADHVGALAAVAAVTGGLCAAARLRPGPWTRVAAAALAIVTVGAEAAWIAWLVARGAWTPAIGLPLHLCDAATVLAAVALVGRRRPAVELLWFWAMAGTVQALLTPDVPERFPGFLWLQYYAAHGGIVAAALFLVAGLGLVPRPQAALRAAAVTAVYAVAVGVVDVLTGGDYLYLRQPPATPSLLGLMGPWPWYLLAAAALALVLFGGLEVVFRWRRPRGAVGVG